MTIGKIYYLATIFEKISEISSTVSIIAGICFLFALVICAIAKFDGSIQIKNMEQINLYSKEDIELKQEKINNAITMYKKSTICTGTVLFLCLPIYIFTPNKKDFLISSMTKDYKPEQIYQMTKEELKNGIDYITQSIKEMEK
ncbi:hypothetical protein KQI68_06995 [Peptoniphilus sp. MSJ-1]|uniref:Uncharacterized protein n=1 Tax=Peptoniphilus ovalis TaxID=2841503 RepID=A0ABS6FHF0_9FIRM|nr:hypothetical protein [Peptoniphilus ovalis]MBU5669584.1 hypothetical protein [Peptoniphilus ovalis]